jgi:succinyl-CoA synthetase beta subunit
MKIHEYQAKALFKEYAIPVPFGRSLKTVGEIVSYASEAGRAPLVLKAQIHGGGRGKAGGIRIARTAKEAEEAALGLLGRRLVTSQTGAEGKPVDTLLVEETIHAEREFYLGAAIDRPHNCAVVIASGEGGVEIEKVAAERPERILVERVHPGVGLRPFQAARIFYGLGLSPSLAKDVTAIILNLFRLFVEKDCSLAEINPLVLTGKGGLVALDAKIDFDDNALFRQPEIAGMRDISQEDPLEVEASVYGLNYIKLGGSVGCMVNGAGLAMATMDLIKYAGAEPANFLDVGGGATSGMVRQGLRILLSDADVKTIFINIFGGILRCDTLAAGVVEAARELTIPVPVIIRLEGTNVGMGRRILDDSGLAFTVALNLKDAVELVRAAISR